MRHLARCDREVDPEGRAVALLGEEADGAAVRLRDRAGDAQAQTGAGHGALAGDRGPEEPLEDPLLVLPGDAQPGVLHRDPGRPTQGREPDPDGAGSGT